MPVILGDRLPESRKLNACSLDAHLAYAYFVAVVPDDFGRGRLSVTLVAESLFPRRAEPGERRAIERRVAAWFVEWERERLILTWECDGVRFFELTRFKPRGNRYHRTPEPPWHKDTSALPEDTRDEVTIHGHTGQCLSSAITQARLWKGPEKAEDLSLRLIELRSRGVAEAQPGTGRERRAPSPPSPPSPPLLREGGGTRPPVENSAHGPEPDLPPPPPADPTEALRALQRTDGTANDRRQAAEALAAYIGERTGLTLDQVVGKASAHYGGKDGRLVRTSSLERMTEAYFTATAEALASWCGRLRAVSDSELQAVRAQGEDATLAPVLRRAARRRPSR